LNNLSPDLARQEVIRRGLIPVDGGGGVSRAAAIEEMRRRGLIGADAPPIGGPISEARAAQPTPQEPKPDDGGFINGVHRALRDMGQQISGAMQGTSPITSDLEGDYLREPLGGFVDNWDGGPAYRDANGEIQAINPTRHVLLFDEKSGKNMVFPRTDDTEESVLSGARLLGMGMINAPGVAGIKAAKTARLGSEKGAHLAEDFARVGVEPDFPTVSQNKVAGVARNALKTIPGSSGITQGRAEKMVNQTARAAEDIGGQFGSATTPQGAGDVIREGLQAHAKRFSTEADKLFGRVDEAIPKGTQVDFANTRKFLVEELSELDAAPDLANLLSSPLLVGINKAVSRNETLPYSVLKHVRTLVGRKMSGPMLVANEDRATLSGLYASLTDDMRAAAEGAGALDAFEQANAFYRNGIGTIRGQFDPLLKKAEIAIFEDIGRAAGEKGAKASAKSLSNLKEALSEPEWGDVGAVFVRQMGRKTPGAADPLSNENFSPARFVTNFAKLSDDAKDLIFGKPGVEKRDALDTLVKVSGAQKSVEALQNTSGTASPLILAATGAGFFSDPVNTSLGLIGANVAARLMASPKFVRFLYRTRQMPDAARVAQLSYMARQSPEIGPDLRALQNAIQQSNAEPSSETTPPR